MPVTVQLHFILTTAPLVAFIIIPDSQLKRRRLTEVAHMLKASQLVNGGAYTRPVDPGAQGPCSLPTPSPFV